jgi:hypothetical protein
MLNQGVDSIGDHWWVSWVHSKDIVERTEQAFDQAISMLKKALPDHFPRP